MPPKIQAKEKSPIVIKGQQPNDIPGKFQYKKMREDILKLVRANKEKNKWKVKKKNKKEKKEQKDNLIKSIDNYLHAGNPFRLTVKQIARICNYEYCHLAFDLIVKNQARLIELKVSAEEITSITSQKSAGSNIKAFVSCYEKLKQLGFNHEQIIKMVSNQGGGDALNTVIRLFDKLIAMLELTEIVTIAANASSTKTLEQYVKLSPALLRHGFTKKQIIALANNPAAANNLIAADEIFTKKIFKSWQLQNIIDFLIKKSRGWSTFNIMFKYIPELEKIFTGDQVTQIVSSDGSDNDFFEALTKDIDQFTKLGFSKKEIITIVKKFRGALIIKCLARKGEILFNYFSTHQVMEDFKLIALSGEAHLKLPAIVAYIENSRTDLLPNEVIVMAETPVGRKKLKKSIKQSDPNKAIKSVNMDIIPSNQIPLYPQQIKSFSQWRNALKENLQEYVDELDTRKSNENCTVLAFAIPQLLQGKLVSYVTEKNIQIHVTVMNNNQQLVTYLTVEPIMHDSIKKILYQYINFQHNFHSISDESQESKESDQPSEKLILSHCTVAKLKHNLTKIAIEQNRVIIALIHYAGACWHFFNAVAFPNNAGQAAFFLVDAQLSDKVYDYTTDEGLLKIDQVCLQGSSEIAYATVASIDFAAAFKQRALPPNLPSQPKFCRHGNKRKKTTSTTRSSLQTKKQKITSTSSSRTMDKTKADEGEIVTILEEGPKQPKITMKEDAGKIAVTWKFLIPNVKIINVDNLLIMLKKIFNHINPSLEEKKMVIFNFNPGRPTSLSSFLFVNSMMKTLNAKYKFSKVAYKIQNEKNSLTNVVTKTKEMPIMIFNLDIACRAKIQIMLSNLSSFMFPWLVFFASINQKWNFTIKLAEKIKLRRLQKIFLELDQDLPKIFDANLNKLAKVIKERDNFIFPQLDLSLKVLDRYKGESYFSSSICLFKNAESTATSEKMVPETSSAAEYDLNSNQAATSQTGKSTKPISVAENRCMLMPAINDNKPNRSGGEAELGQQQKFSQ